eukprot:10589163-Ditylum_brightwellii.AAC.1
MSSTRVGLTKDQTTFFFTNTKQMEVTKKMLAQLGLEGTKKVEDLAECSKDNWKQVTENLKRLEGQMKNLDKVHGNDNPSTIPQTPYPFGVRAQKRLQEALELTSCKHCICNGDPVFHLPLCRPQGSQAPDTARGPKDHR